MSKELFTTVQIEVEDLFPNGNLDRDVTLRKLASFVVYCRVALDETIKNEKTAKRFMSYLDHFTSEEFKKRGKLNEFERKQLRWMMETVIEFRGRQRKK